MISCLGLTQPRIGKVEVALDMPVDLVGNRPAPAHLVDGSPLRGQRFILQAMVDRVFGSGIRGRAVEVPAEMLDAMSVLVDNPAFDLPLDFRIEPGLELAQTFQPALERLDPYFDLFTLHAAFVANAQDADHERQGQAHDDERRENHAEGDEDDY